MILLYWLGLLALFIIGVYIGSEWQKTIHNRATRRKVTKC